MLLAPTAGMGEPAPQYEVDLPSDLLLQDSTPLFPHLHPGLFKRARNTSF